MATPQRRAGLIQFKIGGVLFDARGNFTYNLGLPKRESVVGADGVHGYKEVPQVAMIEGEITDRPDLDLAKLVRIVDETITLKLGNDKVIALNAAWFAADGNASSEEGAIPVKFESAQQGQEIPA